MNIQKASGNPRLCKALTGYSYEEFNKLLETFEKVYNNYLAKRKGRINKPGQGQKGHLPDARTRLFFILFYVKTYPTFDVLGFLSGKSRGRTCEAVHFLLNILKKTLGKETVLPLRKISSVEEFLEKFPEVKDVFLDGSERRIYRPRNKKDQKYFYSGKKKGHTNKNVFVNDDKRRILMLSPTRSGKTHDKRILNEMELVLPKSIGKWTDTGFQGIAKMHENTVLPKKRTKGNPLTILEKTNNKVISSIRVVSEHTIAGIRKYRSNYDKMRNKIGRFADDLVWVASGLHNFHIRELQLIPITI